jgi:quinol monooxygenase YgiN
MYIVTYSYKVPKGKAKSYLDLHKKVKAVYLKHGCLSYEVLEVAEKDGEWMEIGRFESKSHFKRVVARVDKDRQIPKLFETFCSIVDIKKNPVVTKEFVKRI